VGDETNCQFYQFSWQWFLALAQPSTTNPSERVFETYRVLQPEGNDQCNMNGVTGRAAAARSLFIRLAKPKAATIQPVTPGEFDQATGEPLYDQQGNIVFYNVYYNPTECQATSNGYLPNTIEIKASWRILPGADPTYYTMQANIGSGPVTLGLVGFHLVINTKNHPEFVWATLEHATNDPDCTNPQSAPSGGWSFISSTCSKCASGCGSKVCNLVKCPNTNCKINYGTQQSAPPLKGTPTQVCRVYPDGTDPGSMTNGNNNDVNRFNINTLNQQITGANGFLGQLPSDNPMSVWKNYFMVGGLWTNGGVGSNVPNEQRGSLELANTTMETFFQKPQHNCFTCHNYDPRPPASNNPLEVSHIICSLLPTSITGCSSKLQIQAKSKHVTSK